MRKRAAEEERAERSSSDQSQWLASVSTDDSMQFSSETPIALAPFTSPPTALSAHIHAHLELGVVLAGEQKRLFADFTSQALPGDVWMIPMWEPHGWEIPCEHCERVVIQFLPHLLGGEMIDGVSWLSGFAVHPRFRPQLSDEQERKRLMGIARELWAEAHDQRPGWIAVTRAYLLLMLTLLYREWPRPEGPSSVSGTRASGLARVMPVVSALQQEPGRPIAIAEAANLCRLSRRQFCRVFSQTMGVGFQEFTLRARLGHVETLLTTTDLPLETIAAEAGFVDSAHLHRQFVKRYRCAPGAFRKRVQGRG